MTAWALSRNIYANLDTMKNKYIEIGKRLRDLRGSESQTKMSKTFGMPLRTYQRYESGERVPPSPILAEIAKSYKKSVDWILTGEIDVESARASEQSSRAPDMAQLLSRVEESLVREEGLIYRYCEGMAGANNKEFFEQKEFIQLLHDYIDRQEIELSYIYIPQVAGRISAGPGRVPEENAEVRVAFRKEWVKRKGEASEMVLIKVEGDSMEPTLLAGDLVLVDRGRNYFDPRGGIYAIALDDIIMVKRIQMLKDRVKIISDNKKYEVFEVPTDKVKINGKVIWFARELER